jgi:hypothetical protein
VCSRHVKADVALPDETVQLMTRGHNVVGVLGAVTSPCGKEERRFLASVLRPQVRLGLGSCMQPLKGHAPTFFVLGGR